jgi:CRP-like cAMP-binding protein
MNLPVLIETRGFAIGDSMYYLKDGEKGDACMVLIDGMVKVLQMVELCEDK